MSLPTRHSSLLFGLDGIPLTEPLTGVGHYTFELARALAALAPADQFELAYPSRYQPVELTDRDEPPLPANLRAARVAVGALGRHWWSIGLPGYVRRRRINLFHGTNYDVPLWKRCPTVLTIHDLAYFLHPSTHKARSVRRARRRLPLMSRQATLIITPSESVRREVCELLHAPAGKVIAIPEAPRRIFTPLPRGETQDARARAGLDEDDEFLLAVGTVEPRKNLSALVRAFEELARERASHVRLHLVVAGVKGWLSDELYARVADSPALSRIHFTGYLPDRDLRALYSSCAAFVYPSIYEGFGLPPLEASACGAPVVASDIAPLRDTLGDAALLVPPTDERELTRALGELLTNRELRQRLSSAGQKRAALFTWERTARLTLDVYEEAIGMKMKTF